MGRQLSRDGSDSECTFCLDIHRLNHPKEVGVILVVIQLKTLGERREMRKAMRTIGDLQPSNSPWG